MTKRWKDIRDTYGANVRKMAGKSGDQRKDGVSWPLWEHIQWLADYTKKKS